MNVYAYQEYGSCFSLECIYFDMISYPGASFYVFLKDDLVLEQILWEKYKNKLYIFVSSWDTSQRMHCCSQADTIWQIAYT